MPKTNVKQSSDSPTAKIAVSDCRTVGLAYKKMLGDDGARVSKTKTAEVLPQILAGAVCKQLKVCGKANCRCVRAGQKHVQYCRFYRENGRLKKQYIRTSDLESVRAACQSHKELQASLRAGCAQYKQTLSVSRALLRMLSR
jgi:hypothetical protein